MKRILLSLALLVGAAAASQAGVTRMVVHTKSGESVTYEMSKKPTVTFEGDNMSIDLGGDVALVPLSELSHVSYEVMGATTGVSLPEARLEKSAQGFGLRKGENTVQVSTIGGVVIFEQTIEAEEGQRFELPCTMEKGVYVVKVNSLTFKMMKR